MVNDTQSFGIDPAMGHPERALALGYAPTAARDAVMALFALDALLGKLARGTRDPLVAQMRLAWWREALAGLGQAAVPGQPILEALRGAGLGAGLGAVVDGWEALVAGDAVAHGRDRGRTLFAAAADVLGAERDAAMTAGEGWALAGLALGSPDAAVARAARERAAGLLAETGRHRWSRAGRALGALALVAAMDLAGRPIGSPGRVARLLRLRLTGR